MPTLDDTFKTVFAIAVSLLRRDMEESFSKELPAEELLRQAFQRMLENTEAYFWLCPWGDRDNEIFRTGIAVVYEHFSKRDPEIAERIVKEFKLLKAFAMAVESGMPIDFGHLVDELEGHPPLGLRGIFFDVKEKWEFETKTRPVIERGERELEGKT